MDQATADWIGIATALAVLGVFGWYFTRIFRVVLPQRPWYMELFSVLVVLVAALILWSGPSWLGGSAAAFSLALAATFLGLASMAKLPQRHSLNLGAPAPAFVGTDSSGAAYSLAEQRGKLVLLKFFRGHW